MTNDLFIAISLSILYQVLGCHSVTNNGHFSVFFFKLGLILTFKIYVFSGNETIFVFKSGNITFFKPTNISISLNAPQSRMLYLFDNISGQ